MTKRDYQIRRSQLVSNGGVGAIIDVGDESYVVCDITEWRAGAEIRLERLSRRLGRELHEPPSDVDGATGSVQIMRFPRAMFCNHARCRALVEWQESRHGSSDGSPPACPVCQRTGTLVPMRFVLACENGHLGDVPWRRWAHSRGGGECSAARRLYFRVDPTGTGGLESLVVECECGARRSLDGITSTGSMRSVGCHCLGGHPWHRADESCEAEPRVLQRGATNLFYAQGASALDLAGRERAEADGTGDADSAVQEHPNFQPLTGFLKMVPDMDAVKAAANPTFLNFAQAIAEATGVTALRVLELACGTPAAAQPALPEWNQDDVLQEEWAFLVSESARAMRAPELVCRESPLPRLPGRNPFARVLLIDRLREVRAMRSYTRIRPTATAVPVDVGRPVRFGRPWFPAVEVFGEGIFLAFDESFVQEWEARLAAGHPAELEALQDLERVRAERDYSFLPEVSARLIAIHTFAHLLMRQLVFECGYASSALRERIWADPARGMAGLLIYTADGDSEGSLGGLVRQGEPDRLADSIVRALDRAGWCSADPVCRETKGQGLGGFNRAACHACSLVSETSCVLSNTLLDRTLLLGRPDGLPGLLEGVLA